MESNPTAQPLRVYLDTSDWSLITDTVAGKRKQDEPAVEALRAFGKSGRAIFLLSREHLEEFSGLTLGLGNRIRCIQSFPGTYLLDCNASTILESSVAALIDRLHGREEAPLSLAPQAFKDIPQEVWIARVRRLKVIRLAHIGMAFANELSRRAKRTQDSAGRARQFRLMKKMRIGNLETVLSELQRHDPSRQPNRLRTRALIWASQLVWKLAEHRKLTPPRDLPIDESFQRHVFQRVPTELRSDSILLQKLRTEWAEHPPAALLCEKAVIESVAGNLNQKYTRTGSEELDAAHAVFAPFVDVFTADKRVEPPLQKVRLQTKVVRTGQLDKVVEHVRALLEAQA